MILCLINATHSTDSLCDASQVDLLPNQSVGVTLVDVVCIDPGAPAVFGTLPGQSYGGPVAAQHGDAVRSTGSC